MIIAELHGKIPSKLENKEDILTSNVFSFFKYSDRSFWKKYLSQIGIEVSEEDALDAEFLFWQKYDDGTEPDLIVICGNYYLLFEAKFYSGFSKRTSTIESQIDREIKMGSLSAKNENKEFVYIAITAEYNKDKKKYSQYESGNLKFVWTNWQTITFFFETILANEPLFQYREYANDLFFLLLKKKLRCYSGIINLSVNRKINYYSNIFYNKNTSEFKGEFSGFMEILMQFPPIGSYKKLFHSTYFDKFQAITINTYDNIFYDEN